MQLIINCIKVDAQLSFEFSVYMDFYYVVQPSIGSKKTVFPRDFINDRRAIDRLRLHRTTVV